MGTRRVVFQGGQLELGLRFGSYSLFLHLLQLGHGAVVSALDRRDVASEATNFLWLFDKRCCESGIAIGIVAGQFFEDQRFVAARAEEAPGRRCEFFGSRAS
ncbi:MAG TPA: hypothetical protein VEX68_19100, partial [Bryobacteraceae bacterium]|nr:hypothetical protein [Bryobacteraceae bacterium]